MNAIGTNAVPKKPTFDIPSVLTQYTFIYIPRVVGINNSLILEKP
jgi:hypothetical protein